MRSFIFSSIGSPARTWDGTGMALETLIILKVSPRARKVSDGVLRVSPRTLKLSKILKIS